MLHFIFIIPLWLVYKRIDHFNLVLFISERNHVRPSTGVCVATDPFLREMRRLLIINSVKGIRQVSHVCLKVKMGENCAPKNSKDTLFTWIYFVLLY